jgi:hypothetical protein
MGSQSGRLLEFDSDEITSPGHLTRKRKADAEIFLSGPKKRPYVPNTYSSKGIQLISKHSTRTDPLVHHGRHFGRTIRAFCRIQALIRQGLAVTVQLELEDLPEDALSNE